MDHLRWLIRLKPQTTLCVNREHSQQHFLFFFFFNWIQSPFKVCEVRHAGVGR